MGSKATHTTEYPWVHCVNMSVGETYEVHWPHSALGACGTVNQYQTPFYDGVFCNWHSNLSLIGPNNGSGTAEQISSAELAQSVGVQSQTFFVVNDEDYYYPDLIKGMIKGGNFGADVAKYTGSTK